MSRVGPSVLSGLNRKQLLEAAGRQLVQERARVQHAFGTSTEAQLRDETTHRILTSPVRQSSLWAARQHSRPATSGSQASEGAMNFDF